MARSERIHSARFLERRDTQEPGATPRLISPLATSLVRTASSLYVMVVQASPDLVRKATASEVALARPANNSTSLLPVPPAMTLPPQLTGGWPYRRRTSYGNVLCRLWSHRRRDRGGPRGAPQGAG